jgi:hypothetical protein
MGFVETMRLKGLAEEDIYFASRDRELIERLRRAKTAALQDGSPPTADAASDSPTRTTAVEHSR